MKKISFEINYWDLKKHLDENVPPAFPASSNQKVHFDVTLNDDCTFNSADVRVHYKKADGTDYAAATKPPVCPTPPGCPPNDK